MLFACSLLFFSAFSPLVYLPYRVLLFVQIKEYHNNNKTGTNLPAKLYSSGIAQLCTMWHSVYIIALLLALTEQCFGLWCYQCTSATPGCTTPFDWRGVGWLGNPCPDPDDICIKLIERKGAQEVVTRNCLSTFKAFRTDIPADTYEGCRPAARDVQLANWVNNTVKEIDIKRDYYDNTTWCFCFLDNRCNTAAGVSAQLATVLASAALLLCRLPHFD